jgi:hypothetical protein
MWTPLSRRKIGVTSPSTIGGRRFEVGAGPLIVAMSRIGIGCSAHHLTDRMNQLSSPV